MLKDIIFDYIEKNNCVITAAPGNGTSSLILFLINILSETDSDIIFYNPDKSLDRKFIKRFYPNVYNKVLFINSSIDILIEFLYYIDFKFSRLIIDPADSFLSQTNTFIDLIKVLKLNNIKVLCSSQIRTDISNGGKLYSTIENTKLFDYSIWIRNVSEHDELFKNKYVDVWKKERKGNNFLSRYIAKYGKEGNIYNL